jgi:hypothetical protein
MRVCSTHEAYFEENASGYTTKLVPGNDARKYEDGGQSDRYDEWDCHFV